MTLRATAAGAVAAALLGCALSSCATGTDAVDQAAGSSNRFVAGDGTVRTIAAAQRRPAPHVTGTLLDGRAFDLRDLRGNVVVINFWGSWCAPCRVEAPDLEAVYQQTARSGVRFVGVNVKDLRSSALAFERTFHVTFPSLYDRAGRVAQQFRDTPPNAIPATMVIDRRGRVAALFRKSLRSDELLPVVQHVAAEAA